MIQHQSILEKRDILNLIGYTETDFVSARINSIVDGYLDNYQDFIASSYKYFYHDIGKVTRNTVTVGSMKLKSSVLARLLERCERVAVFALTIGGYLEELVDHLSSQGLVLQATVLDAVGSGAAETLASEVQATIKFNAERRGLVISRRFSPGYCDWDVSQQGELFRLLGDEVTGVTLTESMLMMPRKSITGIIGIGFPGKGIREYNPCIACLKKDCPGRRR